MKKLLLPALLPLFFLSCAAGGGLNPSLTVLPEFPYPESRYTRINGTLVHYRVWNPGESSRGNILLIHGLGGSTFSFRYTAPELAASGYTVIAADIPAFGYSDRKPENAVSPYRAADLMWRLLVEAEQSASSIRNNSGWTLIGHSMGGRVITRMAETKPEKVREMVYLAGAVNSDTGRNWIFQLPFAERILKDIMSDLFSSPEKLENTLSSAYGDSPPEELLTGYWKPLSIHGTPEALIAFIKASSDSPSTDPKTVNVPALLIWGENDSWVPVEEGEALRDNLPNARFEIIPGAGHLPMESHPETVNSLILNFLK